MCVTRNKMVMSRSNREKQNHRIQKMVSIICEIFGNLINISREFREHEYYVKETIHLKKHVLLNEPIVRGRFSRVFCPY